MVASVNTVDKVFDTRTASPGQRNMAGSVRATAVGAAERLRRRHVGAVPADASPRRLSLVALLAALCLPIFLTPAHGETSFVANKCSV